MVLRFAPSLLRRLCAGVAFSTLAVGVAAAADLPYRGGAVAPQPVYAPSAGYNWTGVYGGLNLGYDWGKFRNGGGTLFGNMSGFALGGQLGYNYQMGSVVLGLEGDVDYANLSAHRLLLPGPIYTRGSNNWITTVRGRIGFAADRVLVYATGGYAGGQVRATLNDTVLPASFSSSGWRNGFALGAGIEYAFTNSWSVKAEYLYTQLGNRTVFGAPWTTGSGVSVSSVRTGVNYHF